MADDGSCQPNMCDDDGGKCCDYEAGKHCCYNKDEKTCQVGQGCVKKQKFIFKLLDVKDSGACQQDSCPDKGQNCCDYAANQHCCYNSVSETCYFNYGCVPNLQKLLDVKGSGSCQQNSCAQDQTCCQFTLHNHECCSQDEHCYEDLGCQRKSEEFQHSVKDSGVCQQSSCPQGKPCCQYTSDSHECCYQGENCIKDVGCRCESEECLQRKKIEKVKTQEQTQNQHQPCALPCPIYYSCCNYGLQFNETCCSLSTSCVQGKGCVSEISEIEIIEKVKTQEQTQNQHRPCVLPCPVSYNCCDYGLQFDQTCCSPSASCVQGKGCVEPECTQKCNYGYKCCNDGIKQQCCEIGHEICWKGNGCQKYPPFSKTSETEIIDH